MTITRPFRSGMSGLLVAGLSAMLALADEPKGRAPVLPAKDKPTARAEIPDPPPSILDPNATPVYLPAALKLAGVENPEILIAQQRVVEAVALRQLAAVQFLPNINAGTNYDSHAGNLQQASGNILAVNRSAMYAGLGSVAVAAGTVNIPGVLFQGNLSENVFGFLVARQLVRQREFDSIAVRNDIFLRVATGYTELLFAEGHRAIAVKTRGEAAEVARVTAEYALTGQGRPSDADRAAADLAQRDEEILEAENEILTASARLAQVLNLDPSVRLIAADGWVVPKPLVPEPIPLSELIAIAMMQRPELAAQRAAIREAFLVLKGAKLLPFSPNYIVGFSVGTFGGGSNLVAQPGGYTVGSTNFQESRFGTFSAREDVDAVVYWTLRNLGLGNFALIKEARARHEISKLEEIVILNRVRAEVATAYARTHARFAQLKIAEEAIETSTRGFQADLRRTRGDPRESRPIEVLDNLKLLGTARLNYLQAITDYNRAQFELYVALGQPPADTLARPIPASLVPPPALPVSPVGPSSSCVVGPSPAH